MEILRELDPNLTLAQTEATIRAAEKKLEHDDGRLSPAELTLITQGTTVDGRESNIATFEPRETAPLPVALLTEVPPEPFERELFFHGLGQRGLEIICYSDLLVGGKTTEIVACRPLTEPEAEQAEPAVADAASSSATAPASGTPGTAGGLAESVGTPITTPPRAAGVQVSQAAFDLIIEFEGLDQPGLWPGAFSGISLGVGYDLGHVTAAQFERDWGKHLTRSQVGRLTAAIGKKGRAAAAMAPRFGDIRVTRAAAMDVFTSSTLPRFSRAALRAFPGMEKLPTNAQGALVSLVFNRGADMRGPRRREMANIQRIIANAVLPRDLAAVLQAIAREIKSMKRLWDIRTLRGLHRRRDAEAELVLSAAAQTTGIIAATATAASAALGAAAASSVAAAMNLIVPKVAATGDQLVDIAGKHCGIGERYRFGAFVAKNDAAARGPWDCAEFVSWCIYQAAGVLYGCDDNSGNPAKADAYTGYWERDARKLGRMISVEEAAGIPGAVVLRYPPATGIGHIALSDGNGGTLEAKSKASGVVRDVIRGRRWDTGVLIDGIHYRAPTRGIAVTPPPRVYFVGAEGMDKDTIGAIQDKLRAAGFDPGPSDGTFGHQTAEAVLAFQTQRNLLADGEVGPETARALGVLL
jgi:N-acetylmuramoyl-L-alanine amidase